MKKFLALILAVVMVLSLVACGKKAPDAAPEKAPAEATYDENGRLQIKWVLFNQPSAPFSADVESELLTYVEEKYNVDIIPEVVDIHDTETLGLYFAGGGDPDVITASYQVYAMYPDLIDEGIIRSIPEGYLETYMPDWMNNCYAAMSPEAIEAQITYTDGKQYIVPFASTMHAYLMAVRQDWLDAIGMDVPTTMDELVEMLIKFHTDDPDGNGVDDTYGTHNNYLNWSSLGVLGGSYNGNIMTENGVVNTFLNGEAKEWLKLQQKLIAEGGIDPESITDNEDIWKDKFVNGKFGVFVHDSDYFTEGWSASMLNSFKAANPGVDLVIIPPLADENGDTKVLGISQMCILAGSLSFGENCSDEVMQKVMEIKNDLASDYEFYKRCKYGVEGVNYTIDENGVITVIEVADADPMIGSALAHVPTPNAWSIGAMSDWDKNIAETYNNATLYPRLQDELSFASWEENKIETRYSADYSAVIDELSAKIYDASFDFDAEWDGVVEDLKKNHLDDVVDEWNEILGYN